MSSTVVTEQELQLDIVVTSAQWEGLFDSLEVWRSRDGIGGPYENLTSSGWSTARLPDGSADAPASPATGPSANLVGLSLEVRVNEDVDIVVTFTGTNPLSYGQAASQTTSQGQGILRAYVVSGRLVLETVAVGGAAIIRLTGGEAAPLLELPTTEPGSLCFGREARVSLTSGTNGYVFTDHNGSPDYYYRTRFYNTSSGSAGQFGTPFTGAFITGLDNDRLVRGTVDLVDAQGRVLENRLVLLHPRLNGTRVDGKTMVDGKSQVLTDANGHAEFILVRGQPFTVAISGTDIVRDFTAPTDAAVGTFDMLDPSFSSDDAFSVQQPTIDFAVRRST
jgi:hypothetical protein